MNVTVIILAAGKGKRMKSELPKVMHKIGNANLLEHALVLAERLEPKEIRVVINNNIIQNQDFKNLEEKYRFDPFVQPEQLGTADALKYGIDKGVDSQYVLVLYGDTPLLTHETLKNMIATSKLTNAEVTVLGFNANDPTGYGRLITDSKERVVEIVEEKDASDEVKRITLCNSGIMLIKTANLVQILSKISNDNHSKEYYLTDLIKVVNQSQLSCVYTLGQEEEASGVNDMIQLSSLESIFQDKKRKEFLLNGVSIVAPETVFFSLDTKIDTNVKIYPYVYFGRGVEIENGSEIFPFSHIEGAKIGKQCYIGPFARIRSGTTLEEEVKIGNFVEVKNTDIAKGSKASHLSYIGDASLGEKCNIGAGTIFCNYNGKSKQHSSLGNDVFIGSNSSIISPIKIDDNVIVAAGSVITEDVKQNELAIARVRQTNVEGKGRLRQKQKI